MKNNSSSSQTRAIHNRSRLRRVSSVSWLLFCCSFLSLHLPQRSRAETRITPRSVPAEACRIVVTDEQNGWPVSQMELITTHNVRFVSDNAGVVAFDLPELMGQEVWLTVRGHGYERKADGFGSRGVSIIPESGKTIEIQVTRTALAKRLGRLTGGGLFAEAQRFGQYTELKESGILGCDSVLNARHAGKLFWAWGDTTLARYPLGIFQMTGATTSLSPLSKFEPPVHLAFEHFRDAAGSPRGLAEIEGKGPTWLSGLVSLADRQGKKRLVAHYEKIQPPLTSYRTGLCEWDEQDRVFRSLKVLWEKSKEGGQARRRTQEPTGHPVRWTDQEGKDWILFGDPFPYLQVSDSYEDWLDQHQWQALESPKTVVSVDGPNIKVHRGAIGFSSFRNRWVALFTRIEGESAYLGEIWYCEAKSPLGPWGKAIKVLSHDRYTFYNPKMHLEMTPKSSPILLFEGTYTHQFSGNSDQTPREDYNQILYRLDLDDPKLKPAQSQ